MSSLVARIINLKIRSLYLQQVMLETGWSEEYMRVVLVDFVTDGRGISLYDYIKEVRNAQA